MGSFVFSENSDQYKVVLWRQFYHSQKKEFLYRKRVQLLGSFIALLLLLLAYAANGSGNNLVAASILFLVLCFWALLFLTRRSVLKKSIADFPNRHPYTITLDEEAITYTTVLGHSEMKWAYFQEYDEFEGNFILYPHEKPKEPIYLPLSLASDGEVLAALVREHIKKKE